MAAACQGRIQRLFGHPGVLQTLNVDIWKLSAIKTIQNVDGVTSYLCIRISVFNGRTCLIYHFPIFKNYLSNK